MTTAEYDQRICKLNLWESDSYGAVEYLRLADHSEHARYRCMHCGHESEWIAMTGRDVRDRLVSTLRTHVHEEFKIWKWLDKR